MFLRRSDKQGLLLWMILSSVLFFGIWVVEQVDWLLTLFLSINISTFLVMLLDKIQSTQAGRRLSERSLYLMTFFGGSIGMVVAMYTIRHKSRKMSFQLVVWAVILLQLMFLSFIYSSFFSL